MINTVQQLMHNIRLFVALSAPALHRGGKPELKFYDTAYFESYATDVFITPYLLPCSVEGC